MMRVIAYTVSFLFHPLFVVTYMAILLSLINPYLFGVHHISENFHFLIMIFLYTFVIPVLGSIMIVLLGFADSIEMKEKSERIGPLIITLVFYLWMSYNAYKSSAIPNAFTIFLIGSTIGLCIAFFVNVFSKISLHALGMGGLLGMIVITMFLFSYGHFNVQGIVISMNILLVIVILISGLVGTSRLILEAHEPMDLYGGFFIGFGAQFLALNLLT